MKTVLDIFTDLQLSIDNGKCLDIIKREMAATVTIYENIKSSDSSTIAEIREVLHTLQAYEVLIDNFEKYLGHER